MTRGKAVRFYGAMGKNDQRGGSQRTLERLESRLLLSTVTVSPVLVAEGNATQMATLTARLNAPSASNTVLLYSTQNGTATNGLNFVKTSSYVFIPAGATSATFNIPILANNLHQGLTSFGVNLAVNAGHTLAQPRTTVYIADNDPAPRVAIGDLTVTAGAASQTAYVPVTLTGASTLSATVNYATMNSTALAGLNFQAAAGSLTFAPGETTKLIPVQLLPATPGGGDKVFNVILTGATNATLSSATGGWQHARIAIRDNAWWNTRPTITVSHALADAGDPAKFNVTLSAATTRPVTLRYQTKQMTPGGAKLVAADGILTIPAGSNTATINVQTQAGEGSADENFALVLSAPTNANLASTVAWGKITAEPPTLSVSDPSVTEGNSSTKNLTFTVTLSKVYSKTVTVAYATDDATAADASDYDAASGTLTFAPGETTKTVNVTINGDATIEADETLKLELSNATESTIADATGLGTILNDDLPSLSIDAATVTEEEGNVISTTLTYTVTLSQASTETVTVQYTSSDVTATAGSDYTTTSGTITFAPGETSKTIDVPITATDSSLTATETFNMTLSNADNATINTASAVGTIEFIGVLSDNITQPHAGYVGVDINQWLAAQFSTGSTTGQLQSVTLSMYEFTPGTVSLNIYSDIAGGPGILVGTLSAPSSLPTGGAAPVTFEASGITLGANTNYWAALVTSNGVFAWSITNSNSGSGDGYTGLAKFSNNGALSWNTLAPGNYLRMKVVATV
jgi:chitinase